MIDTTEKADTIQKQLEKTLFIDIETVPHWRSLTQIPAAPYEENGNILLEYWERRYAKDRSPDESPDKHFLDKAAIHAVYGRIVCIGMGWLGKPNGNWLWRETVLHGLNEKEILSDFIKIWTDKFTPKPNSYEVVTLCGHNLLNFDYIFLGRRIILNDLDLPMPWQSSLTQPHWTLREYRLVDTMRLWSMGDSGGDRHISLEVLARVLNIPFRKSLSHDRIRELFFQWEDTGEERYFRPVIEYCAEDVRTLAKIYLHLIGRKDLTTYIKPAQL